MAPISLGLGLGLTKGGAAAVAGPAGPIYDADFAAGAALPAGFTLTRTTAAMRRTNAGIWESVASGVLRYHHTAASAPLGILIEEARTSRALWNRDLTNAAWTSTNITAVKNATGVDGIASSASTLTATAANGTCLQVITLTNLARVFYPWVRRKTGAGTVEITINGGTAWTNITSLINSSTYTQVVVTATVTNPSVGFRVTTSGDEIEVDFAELTDGTFATSPIETTTASATRNADAIAGPAFPAQTSARVDCLWPAVTGVRLVGSGTSNRSLLQTRPGIVLGMDTGGTLLVTANSAAAGAAVKAASRASSTGRAICLNGGTVATDATDALLSGTTLGLGYNNTGAGGSFLNASIARFRLWDRLLGNAELQAETT